VIPWRRPFPAMAAPRPYVFLVLLAACSASVGRPRAVSHEESKPGTAVAGSAESPAARPPAALEPPPPPPPPPAPRPQLPGGGRELFPSHRLVGFCGTPGAPALGELWTNLPKKTKALLSLANDYAHAEARPVLPVFELIAVIVMSYAGRDGKYRRRVDDAIVEQYLKVARGAGGLLLLNIQPGQSDFLTEVKHFERFLREPDVGVALDPEWAMKPKQLPGKYYGQTTGADINAVAQYLATLVKEGDLPEKALVFHQVNKYVVKDEPGIAPAAGVVIVKSVDGLGPKASKIETYDILTKAMSTTIHAGFKLFFDEDTRSGGKMMSVKEVMTLAPPPEYVMYE
jgi:hypothetical protein